METEGKLNQQKETLEEWAARIDAMPENPDSLAVLDRINKTGRAYPHIEPMPPSEHEYPIGRRARCACNVAGCDPAGVRECEKGIRERRALP